MTPPEYASEEVAKLLAQSREILERIEVLLKKHEPEAESDKPKSDE